MIVATILAFLFFAAGPAPALPQPSAPPRGPLEVEAWAPSEDTGTMHYAKRLTIRWGDAEPLVLGADDENAEDTDEMVPYPGPSFLLSGNRALLVAWDSPGGGMEDMHALLVERRGSKLEVTDHLVLQSDRPSSALLIRREGPRLRIGIFRPERIVQDEDGWFLTSRAGSIHMPQLRRLRWVSREPAPSGRDGDFDYVYQSGDEKVERPKDVAWIEIGASGFRLPSAKPAAARGRRRNRNPVGRPGGKG